jgi:hypothetical protein
MQVTLGASQASTHTAPAKPGVASTVLVTGVPYSDRVSGKTYSTDVVPMESEYEASVANLPGATVIDSTVDHVEERLNNLISFFA